ncbi:TLC domain-containing protein 4-B isoform X2 [Pimephales promelas]|uniref:TLC domain-containing protein 4-B isoform X2 n=2 Tax=Pimephales promelas TaxID=90988 RepID=UPI001955A1CE|nr:TLC domain-containing protein 4-B isoform X2 [Pimephales promelas]XP_039513066.1 TLC domain-containing protein 4-B isoform X2 [Pimephales promelas]XP_039513067.1 TLC domain-containing protein 4-B isoform X2 [Pimephales promelas]KAG1933849.1 TRAM, LAG1 and CLN8 (TLC) lipid-sensing domain containing protein [Pimephales promelas]KAG1933853.1 TRAM, LAG1 and CLN8 (TLC) lipid-sensing domain containing protein [Pimephales promelas]
MSVSAHMQMLIPGDLAGERYCGSSGDDWGFYVRNRSGGSAGMEPLSLQVLVVVTWSFLGFQWLFYRGSPWVSQHLSKGFLRLSPTQRTEWNSRAVSTVHALIVGLFCLYIYISDEPIQKDPVWGDATLVKLNVAITSGYLISDLLLMFTSWESIGEKYFVIHHFAALYAYYYVLSQGILPYFANFRLLSEFSTPFVNQRWFFHVLGYHKLSKPSLVNGVAMAFAFFLVRIAVIPGYYSHMYSVFGTDDFYKLPLGGRSAWVISSVSLDVMNIMWMRRIIRGCLKVLHSAWSRKAGTEMETRKTD